VRPAGKFQWQKGNLIGRGAIGKVYQAMDSATGAVMAVKQVVIANDNQVKWFPSLGPNSDPCSTQP